MLAGSRAVKAAKSYQQALKLLNIKTFITARPNCLWPLTKSLTVQPAQKRAPATRVSERLTQRANGKTDYRPRVNNSLWGDPAPGRQGDRSPPQG